MASVHSYTLKFPQDLTPVAESDASSRMTYDDFVAVSPDNNPATFTITRIQERIAAGHKSGNQVYRATMHVSSISLNGSVTVILKVAMGRTYVRNLLKEAEIYLDKLKPLFTSRVPHVYGFWQGETYEGQTAVMVMQDCGRPLKRDIVQQPPKFRQLVIDHLVAVHRAGVSFRDFGMDNVVAFQTPEGSFYPMLVGFGHADGSHECPFKGDIGVYSPQPKEPLPCSQLWHVALMAEAFYQYNVDFYGREISLKTISSTMDLVKMRPEGISEAQALYDADDIIRRFNIWQDRRLAMDNGPVRLD